MLQALLLCAVQVAGASPDRGPSSPQVQPASGVAVEVEYDEEGATLLSIQARDVSVHALLDLVARRLRVELTGFDLIVRDPKVSAYLVRRPYRDALRWTLGSVGLAAEVDGRRIHVREDVSPYPTAHALLEEASRRYFVALRDHGDWPLADRAEMARAEIEERLGPDHGNAAVLSYDALVRQYPKSDLVPEAILRAARILARSGDWSQAVLRYEELANLDYPHPFHVDARRELAESLCRLGEAAEDARVSEELGRKAIHYLDALDTAYPTQEAAERRARFIVRSRAHSLVGEGVAALRSLDAAARYSVAGENDPVLLELRALAFARSGDHASSSTAWLAYAEECTGAERERATIEAARAALRGGHEVAVLAIERAAANQGFAQRLAAEATEARLRLGLATTSVEGAGPRANLLRGRDLMEKGAWRSAADALRLAHEHAQELPEGERTPLALDLARCLSASQRLAAAIEVLRQAAEAEGATARREPIYRLASQLYEDHSMLDEAIAALKGRL